MTIRTMCILFCLLFIVSYKDELATLRTEVFDPYLDIVVSVTQTAETVHDSLLKVYGRLTVANHTKEVQSYGNEYLTATASSGEVERAYLDAPISHVIDFSTIEIRSMEIEELKVHWVYRKSARIFPIQLNFDRLAMEADVRQKQK